MKHMKKAVAWGLMLLLFVGCGATENVPKATYPYACSVSITQGTVTTRGACTAHWSGCYTIQLTEPDYFAGMTIQIKGGQSQIKWKDWLEEQEVALPHTSVFVILASVLDDLARSEQPSQLTKTTAVYELNGHTVVCDRTNGRPMQVRLQDGTQIHLADLQKNNTQA